MRQHLKSLLNMGWLLLAMLMILAQPSPASAQENADLKFHGFLSLVGGEFFGGSFPYSQDFSVPTPNYPFNQHIPCPCFVSNWANAGVYSNNRFTLAPDSVLGAQLDYKIDAKNALSFQMTARDGMSAISSLQWLYWSHDFDNHWGIHVGRQRIPLFYYSANQDIGFTYPWMTVSDEVYGYESTNYNGISGSYRGALNGVAMRLELYTGFEYIHSNPYAGLIATTQESATRWKNIIGTAATFSKDFWTVHLNYLRGDVTWAPLANAGNLSSTTFNQHMQAFGVALNLDFDNYFVSAEYGQFIRNNYNVVNSFFGNNKYTEFEPSYALSVGARWGAFTPSITYNEFRDRYSYQAPQDPIPTFPNKGWKASLRYDINATSDIKIQYDYHTDGGTFLGDGFPTTGGGKLIRVGYDMVF